MKKSNKKLLTLLIVFALVFVLGGVYAAAAGVLTFQGVANLNESAETDDLKVEFVSGYCRNADGKSTGTATVSEDGQTMTITANIDQPGDGVYFGYFLKNTGTVDAYLTEWKLESPNPDLTKALYVSKPPTEKRVMKVGEGTGECTVYVKWNKDAEAYAGQTFTWTYTLDYVDNNAR